MKLRRHGRMYVRYRASFNSDWAHGEGMVVNISIGGCRARSLFLTHQDDCLRAVIHLPGDKSPLYIMRGIVRWTNSDEFGMEFMDIEHDDRRRLNEVIGNIAGQGD